MLGWSVPSEMKPRSPSGPDLALIFAVAPHERAEIGAFQRLVVHLLGELARAVGVGLGDVGPDQDVAGMDLEHGNPLASRLSLPARVFIVSRSMVWTMCQP